MIFLTLHFYLKKKFNYFLRWNVLKHYIEACKIVHPFLKGGIRKLSKIYGKNGVKFPGGHTPSPSQICGAHNLTLRRFTNPMLSLGIGRIFSSSFIHLWYIWLKLFFLIMLFHLWLWIFCSVKCGASLFFFWIIRQANTFIIWLWFI